MEGGTGEEQKLILLASGGSGCQGAALPKRLVIVGLESFSRERAACPKMVALPLPLLSIPLNPFPG